MGQSKIKATMITQIFGNVLNIVLDIVFVVGFDMAVGGVAVATLIAQITTFGIGLFLVQRSTGFRIRQYVGLAKMTGAELMKDGVLLSIPEKPGALFVLYEAVK